MLAQYSRAAAAPIVLLKNGESYQGRIVEFSDTEIALRPLRQRDTDSDSESAESAEEGDGDAGEASEDGADSATEAKKDLVDIVELKNGGRRIGQIVSQNRQSVTIQIDGKRQTLSKAEISRVQYRVPRPEQVELVRILRTDIRKILIR